MRRNLTKTQANTLPSWQRLLASSGVLGGLLVMGYGYPVLGQEASNALPAPALLPAAPPATLQRPTLQIGSRGDVVSELQAALKLLGYYTGSVDGIYSDGTAQAVIKFQTEKGLSPDGIAGKSTWNQLFPPTSLPSATPASVDAINPTTPVMSQSNGGAAASMGGIEFPILKRGMRGSAVRGLQERLKAKGFLQGAADGVFGAETQAAVKAAQTQYQLTADGVVGAATWSILLP